MKSTCHNSLVKHYKNGYYCTTCLKEQQKTRSHAWILYAGLSITFVVGVLPAKAPILMNTQGTYSINVLNSTDIIPSDSAILDELVKHKCVLSSVAVAQARIETGNYTSDIAVHNKNLFGIKAHKCTYVKGVRNGHATFASYRDNIACYCHIQQLYLGKIHKAYAEDTMYCSKLKRMK